MKTLKYILVSLLVFSCAATDVVLSEFDESVEFDNYNTFVLCIDDLFVENSEFPNHDNNKIRELISEAIEVEMINKGHKTNVLNPQLQAGFRLLVEKKEVTFTNCEVNDEYNYWQECTIDTMVYTEETLVVYVSDISKNQIIWQASLKCDLNRSDRKLKEYIDTLVETIFNEYPKVHAIDNNL